MGPQKVRLLPQAPTNLEIPLESCSPIQFLEFMKAHLNTEPQEAWREFRKAYDQNILPGKTGEDRATFFRTKLEEYKKYPVALVGDLRAARVENFYADLGTAFMSCTDIGELEVEEWIHLLQTAKQGPYNIQKALDAVWKYDSVAGLDLTEAARVLWPHIEFKL